MEVNNKKNEKYISDTYPGQKIRRCSLVSSSLSFFSLGFPFPFTPPFSFISHEWGGCGTRDGTSFKGGISMRALKSSSFMKAKRPNPAMKGENIRRRKRRDSLEIQFYSKKRLRSREKNGFKKKAEH